MKTKRIPWGNLPIRWYHPMEVTPMRTGLIPSATERPPANPLRSCGCVRENAADSNQLPTLVVGLRSNQRQGLSCCWAECGLGHPFRCDLPHNPGRVRSTRGHHAPQPHILSAAVESTNQLRLVWQAETSIKYGVEFSPSIVTNRWTRVILPTGATVTATDDVVETSCPVVPGEPS
jgi:hypothetical protein